MERVLSRHHGDAERVMFPICVTDTVGRLAGPAGGAAQADAARRRWRRNSIPIGMNEATITAGMR